MYTEAINHGPGVTFLQTGTQIAGRPSMGSWLSYGLGPGKRRTCRRLSCSLPKTKAASPWARICGGAAFCRPDIKASYSARRSIRCSTSTIPQA